MRRVAVTTALLVAAVLVATPAYAIFGTPRMPKLLGGQNGGSTCAGCTLIVGLVSQTMELKSLTPDQSMDLICGYLPYSAVKDICKLGVALFGSDIASLLAKGETPDTVCNAIGMCKDETAVCRLFPAKSGQSEAEHARNLRSIREAVQSSPLAEVRRKMLAAKKSKLGKEPEICTWLPEVCQVEDHLPAFDSDKDTFSTYESLRGSYWRGKDCDDLDASVFPGRNSNDEILDSNCNGIVGVDATTGQTYEDQWCKGTGSMGVAALGDSATAHFHLPPNYFNASMLSEATFANVLRLLENEADWPMLSWSSGHLNASDFLPDIYGPDSSVYSLLRQNNLCNHRDYANLGVNGAASQNLFDFSNLLNRNGSDVTKPVKPLLLIMSMIGNDVCNHEHDFNRMTKPEDYYNNVMKALTNVDGFLPNGSKVILIPLVDGRILYDTMHDRIHPIGWTNKDVTYTDLYDYLNCLDVSPCWGWMNSNATVRNMTWEHASAMNAQLPRAAAAAKGMFKNIDVTYLGNVFDAALQSYTGPRWELIEPVDGFHPSQLANALLGSFLFNTAQSAGLVGPANPNNAAIAAKFGNQGGY